MRREKSYLIIGIGIGLLLSFLYFQYFAPRYDLRNTGLSMVKMDTWTGKTWKFAENKWNLVVPVDENSKEVDKVLHEALQIPYDTDTSNQALVLLRKKYPVLKNLTDDDLLERIKVVYSKQILCSLYFDNFMRLQSTAVKTQPSLNQIKN